jgi:GH15 family glucan-1,4-alpha-glucosidase
MATSPTLHRAQRDPLFRRSLEVLKAGQSPTGALIASPDFGVYRYAWLRDGAFCAHALDVAGETDAADAWHRWVEGSIRTNAGMLARAIADVEAGDAPRPEAMPPARYTLDGALETESGDIEPWPNFQLDGYGMWLWSLAAHLGERPLPSELESSVQLVARYLATCWQLRCWNCWEEYDGGEHASTLAPVAAGLAAAALLLGESGFDAEAWRIRGELVARYTIDGRFRRGAADDRVDGSLVWLSVPFAVLAPDDPLIAATVDAVRTDLAGPGGGIYRFLGDTYYGGGQWLLLTSLLAWHDRTNGNHDAADASQDWVRARALENGDLPEQVHTDAQDPAMVEPWVERWGAVATPLLWSHAMYVIAEAAADA